MGKSRKLILFGTGDLARIAWKYFERDTYYEVAAFTVDREYLNEKEFCGLPVVPFDEINGKYPPDTHDIHICLIYNDMNRTRSAKCEHAKAKGYKLASYISPHAFVDPTTSIGEHCFIFESNVIQPFVTIGNNCILWSGNHVGHHSRIGDNVFISSHVVISGYCNVGDNSFIGVNSTLANNTNLGGESWVMHGSILGGMIPSHSFVKSVQSEVVPMNEPSLNRALERAKR